MRLLRVLLVLAVWTAASPLPPAHALTPPVIDRDRLPAPAVPAPPEPTTRRAPCIDPVPGAAHGVDVDALHRHSDGAGQRVAIIDTGVHRHPRLAHVEAAGDYVSVGDGTDDCDGHGTAVAGIIAEIAPAATLLAIRQSTVKFGPTADPGVIGFGDVDTMAQAVRTAADLGATVINISSVACTTGPLDDAALGAALAYAVDVKDAVVVTAAGNTGGPGQCPPQSGSTDLTWAQTTVAVSPAWYDDYVLTVGSVDGAGTASVYTQAGPWVDLAAPGEDMIPAAPAGVAISGTSYSAPVVSGVVALLRARSPGQTARQVMQRIQSTAVSAAPGRSPLTGFGVLDPAAALRAAEPVAPAPAAVAPAAGGHPRRTAVIGAAGCAAAAVLALVALSWSARLRRP